MKIGVIGIGEMGGTIARKWSEKGHSVRVANSRGPEAVKRFADEVGVGAADIYGAVEGADVVLLSIPFPAVAKLPNDLFDRAAEGVVSTTPSGVGLPKVSSLTTFLPFSVVT